MKGYLPGTNPVGYDRTHFGYPVRHQGKKTIGRIAGNPKIIAAMDRTHEIPELLDVFMAASGTSERWITVYEFRMYFHLDESCATAISGYLRRIYRNSMGKNQYCVAKTEKIPVKIPQRRMMTRYLVKKRPAPRRSI